MKASFNRLDIMALINEIDNNVKTEFFTVKETLAMHTSFIEVLEMLAEDESSSVREKVAQNPFITPEVSERLFRDKSDNVRWSVVKFSKYVTERMLIEALKDKYWAVRQEAARRLEKNDK